MPPEFPIAIVRQIPITEALSAIDFGGLFAGALGGDVTRDVMQELLLSADRGLYMAKHEGQNRVVMARSNDPKMLLVSTKFLGIEENQHPEIGMDGVREIPPSGIDGL
jgi:hypothetical protein